MFHRVARLCWAGRKAIRPRIVVLAALKPALSHPTAVFRSDRIRRSYLALVLSTIYQTLAVCIRTGLCRRVSGLGDRLCIDGTLQGRGHTMGACGGHCLILTRSRYSYYPRRSSSRTGRAVSGMCWLGMAESLRGNERMAPRLSAWCWYVMGTVSFAIRPRAIQARCVF